MSQVFDFVTKAYSWAKAQEKMYGIPFRYALAQSGLETGYGASVKGNGFFGIQTAGRKPTPHWNGNPIAFMTHERINGQLVLVNGSFCKYNSGLDSFLDWGYFIARSPKNYVNVMANIHKGDEAFLDAMAKSPYATIGYAKYYAGLKGTLSNIDKALAIGKFATSSTGKSLIGICFLGLVGMVSYKYL